MFATNSDPALADRIALDMASAPPAVAASAMESSFAHYEEMPAALKELKLPVVALNVDSQPTDLESLERHGVGAGQVKLNFMHEKPHTDEESVETARQENRSASAPKAASRGAKRTRRG